MVFLDASPAITARKQGTVSAVAEFNAYDVCSTDRDRMIETTVAGVERAGPDVAGNALGSAFRKCASIFGTLLSCHNAPDQLTR